MYESTHGSHHDRHVGPRDEAPREASAIPDQDEQRHDAAEERQEGARIQKLGAAR